MFAFIGNLSSCCLTQCHLPGVTRKMRREKAPRVIAGKVPIGCESSIILEIKNLRSAQAALALSEYCNLREKSGAFDANCNQPEGRNPAARRRSVPEILELKDHRKIAAPHRRNHRLQIVPALARHADG